MPVYMHHYVYVHITESQRSVSQRLRGASSSTHHPSREKMKLPPVSLSPSASCGSLLCIASALHPLPFPQNKAKQKKKVLCGWDGMELMDSLLLFFLIYHPSYKRECKGLALQSAGCYSLDACMIHYHRLNRVLSSQTFF
jgi:hypothetical protein